MRRFFTLLFAMVLTTLAALAQNKVVTGQITDEKGDPIGFASVKIKDSKQGVSADANGNFRIEAPVGSVLVVTAVGANQKEFTVTGGQSNYSVSLTKGSTELSTVVVSALGIKRSVKSTPYAVQQISGDRLTQTRQTDITTGLAGKIAGVQVLGQAGSKLGSNGVVRLRGVGSLGDKNAIFVVDGTILSNVSDINVDDIASVNVLKGPNATALYGQRAEGGVIIITTKKARKSSPLQVDVTTTNTVDVVGMLPAYQNEYGGGNNDNFYTFQYNSAVHPAAWASLNGKRFHNFTDDASWGPRFDGGEYIPWYAWVPGTQYTGKTAAYVSQPNNIRNFYAKGFTTNNNLSLSYGGSFFTIRAGYNYIKRNGILPYSTQDKNQFTTQSTVDVLKNLTLGINASYSFENIKGDFNDTYSNQASGSFNQWFHRDLDTKIEKELVDLKTPIGTYASWNPGFDPINGNMSQDFWKGNYWTNHYTWLKYYEQKQKRDRLFGDVSLAYKLNNDIRITGTYRFNWRKTETNKRMPNDLALSVKQSTDYDVPRGTAPFPTTYPVYNFYKNYDTKYYEENIELNAQYTKNFGNFNLDALVGGNLLHWETKDSTRMTSFGLVKPDVFDINNSAGLVYRAGTFLSRKKVYSMYAKATLGYRDIIYLDASARQDFSSVLPKEQNGYFYPSVGVSFVFSDYVKNAVPAVSFAKLRLSWAQIGTDALSPYEANPTYFIQTAQFNGNSLISVPNTIFDPNIQPTLNSSYEGGIDLRFFRDRIGISATYYRENKTNDIVRTQVSSASGYTALTFNAGSIKRNGVELQLDARPIITKNFSWDVSFNWSTYKSEVVKVSDQQDFIQYGVDAFGVTTLYNKVGSPWGELHGIGIKRLNGVPVLNNDGTYAVDNDVNFGSILPSYNGGFFTSFNYKGINLSAAFDFQQGGKFFSLSHYWGTYSGLYANTAAINDKGHNVRDDVANGGGVHVYGVSEDGRPVDYYVEAQTYFHQNGDLGIADFDILDASYLKCREITLSYNFNTTNWGGFGKHFKKLSLAAFARNPFNVYTGNRYIDPSEVAGGAAAYEDGQLPGTRSYGATLKVSF
jgi:TonB-linked SusC/RagA family outer membrane protein